MKAKNPSERSKSLDNLIAYHEAGHAVMAFHKGGKFMGVGIDISRFVADADGVVAGLEWSSKKGTRKNNGLVLLAGMSAVAILRECPYCEDRNRSDIEAFYKLWRTKKTVRDNFHKLYSEAIEFLSNPEVWRQVEVVATILLKKGVLLYKEVQLCIESEERKEDFEFYLKLNDISLNEFST